MPTKHEAALEKSGLAIYVARLVLGPSAPIQAVEDQAVALMHIPDDDLLATYERVADRVRRSVAPSVRKRPSARRQSTDLWREVGTAPRERTTW